MILRVHNQIVPAVLIAALLISAPQGLKEFRDSFAMRRNEFPTEKPDPAIQKCMDMIIQKTLKDTTRNTPPEQVEQIATYFSRGIAAEEASSTEYKSIGIEISWGQGRTAIGVRMGAASRLRVFSTVSGKAVPVPKEVDWVYRYESGPTFLPGGGIVLNGYGIQDAGVRYGYRAMWLKPGASGYTLGKIFPGVWFLEDKGKSHLAVDGTTLTLSTLDEPKSFMTTNATPLFERVSTYDLSGAEPVLTKTDKKEPAFRALDAWIAKAIKAPTTALEKRFRSEAGKDMGMLDDWSTTRNGALTKIDLELEAGFFTFTLKNTSNGYAVTNFAKTRK